MVWLPLALYMFWGPFVVWGVLVALAALRGAPLRLQLNLVAISGAVLGLVAVTVGWEFDTPFGYRDIPMGLWFFLFASWFCLLSPLASIVGMLALVSVLNTAHLYDYTIVGNGYAVAVVSVIITVFSMVYPISVSRGYERSDRSRNRRLLMVRVGGFRKKEWSKS